MDETFKINLAKGAKVTANSGDNANQIGDENASTFWIASSTAQSAEIIIELNSIITFDRILLQEPIRYGQRISKFKIQAEVNGKWQDLVDGTTIGYKRLLRIDSVTTAKLKIQILEANNAPALSNIGLYKASSKE